MVLDQKAINPRRTLLVPCDMAYILAGFDRSFAGPRLASRALLGGCTRAAGFNSCQIGRVREHGKKRQRQKRLFLAGAVRAKTVSEFWAGEGEWGTRWGGMGIMSVIRATPGSARLMERGTPSITRSRGAWWLCEKSNKESARAENGIGGSQGADRTGGRRKKKRSPGVSDVGAAAAAICKEWRRFGEFGGLTELLQNARWLLGWRGGRCFLPTWAANRHHELPMTDSYTHDWLTCTRLPDRSLARRRRCRRRRHI